MRFKTITLYKFSELSEESKQRAIKNLHAVNVDCFWQHSIYEDAGSIGLRMFPERGQGIGLTLRAGWLADEVARKILDDHANNSATHKLAKNFLNKLSDYKVSHSLKVEFLQELEKEYNLIFHREYKRLTSKEAIEETIRSSEYEFTEDGALSN